MAGKSADRETKAKALRLCESHRLPDGRPNFSHASRETGVSRQAIREWWAVHIMAHPELAVVVHERAAKLHRLLPPPEPTPQPEAAPASRPVDPATMTAVEYHVDRYVQIQADIDQCRRCGVFGPLPALHKLASSAFDSVQIAVRAESETTGKSADEILAGIRANAGRASVAVLEVFIGEARRRGVIA